MFFNFEVRTMKPKPSLFAQTKALVSPIENYVSNRPKFIRCVFGVIFDIHTYQPFTMILLFIKTTWHSFNTFN